MAIKSYGGPTLGSPALKECSQKIVKEMITSDEEKLLGTFVRWGSVEKSSWAVIYERSGDVMRTICLGDKDELLSKKDRERLNAIRFVTTKIHYKPVLVSQDRKSSV